MSRFMNASPTVPASPRGESSIISTSADSQQCQGGTLLRYEEIMYLKFYGIDQFSDMRNNEYKNQFQDPLHNQDEITKHLRASVIDWLFEVSTKLEIEDKGVIFQAISLMDRFYD